MDLPVFGSSYVPPSHFDYYSWLRPDRPPSAPNWYYWIRRRTPHESDTVDLKTVDPLLQPMILFAQANGIGTFPSCQGHFPTTEELEEQLEWLIKELPLIQLGKLRMTDVETGEVRRPAVWNLSLPSAFDFVQHTKSWSGCGRVGFLMHSPEEAERLAWSIPEGIDVKTKGRKVSISVCASTPWELESKWLAVQHALRFTV